MKISNSADIPSSVYRLQLNSEFTLKQAIKIIPYLKNLGIEGIYCSPYYDAFSSHGYDVTNPNALNPQIGTMDEFREFCELLRNLNLKHIIDVVPNHMGFKGGKNFWWQDVLENGPYSEFATFFDINWSPEKKELQDRVLLPILGENYGKSLENQEVKLFFKNEGRFSLQYKDYPLPVQAQTYAMILETDLEALKGRLGEENEDYLEYVSLIELYHFFPVVMAERSLKKEEGEKRLAKLVERSSLIKKHIQKTVSNFNGKKRIPASFDMLDRLLESQFYRLSYWRVASHEINYRRFFNIHELVAIRIEEEEVLKRHHEWLFKLIEEDKVQGLRIDHPDGLYDPIGYFEKIRKIHPIYTVVEKILDSKEELPESWQVEGTVGYEYMNLLNGLFINQEAEKQFTEIYEEFIGYPMNFEEILYESKKLFSTHEMVSEVMSLSLKLDRISENTRYFRDFTRQDLTRALGEVIACFPVYRTYVTLAGRASKKDRRYIHISIEKAKKKARDLDASLFDFLEKLLLMKLKVRKDEENRYRDFALRFQQLTAPMMAKGLEDTAFYIYNRFISLNDVGGNPPHFGNSVHEFHKFNKTKKEKWPFGLISTSTHDTKRSEDIRMRLNVLSEIPERWRLEVKKWSIATNRFKRGAPTPNLEYFIYQTLLGMWPRSTVKKSKHPEFVERVWQIILKSMREAKEETDWISPNLKYEENVQNFILTILSQEKENLFLKCFIPFFKEIDHYGSLNSLSSMILKMASCGVVDVYQGNELLNYKLVDPDNRSLVDYELRRKLFHLAKKNDSEKLFTTSRYDELKLFLHYKCLNFRRENKKLFLDGEYIPLKVRGEKKEHVVAFMRIWEDKCLLALSGRLFSKLSRQQWQQPLDKIIWGNAEVILPDNFQEAVFENLFTEKKIQITRSHPTILSVAEAFRSLPFCWLYSRLS